MTVASPHRLKGRHVAADERLRHNTNLLANLRGFVTADGRAFPVGPCGYVPRSALLDPARRPRDTEGEERGRARRIAARRRRAGR